MSLDAYDLERFVLAQEEVYERALGELRRGGKESHWMWYIFPQLKGLGFSHTAQRYGISGLDEAAVYLRHPILGPRLLECCRVLLTLKSDSASDVFGYPDDLKLRSSMTLFSLTAAPDPCFREVLVKFFSGEGDPLTVAKVGR